MVTVTMVGQALESSLELTQHYTLPIEKEKNFRLAHVQNAWVH